MTIQLFRPLAVAAAIAAAGLFGTALAAPLVPTPGSPSGYLYFPKPADGGSGGGVNIQLPPGRQLCTIISSGDTRLELASQPPETDIEVSYFIAGGGAGAGASSIYVSPTSGPRPGGDGEVKRGKFTILAGDTATYRLVVGAGGNAGGIGAYSGSVTSTKNSGRGGGGGAGWRGGGSGQQGPSTGSGISQIVSSAGGGGGSSAIVRGSTVIVAANGGDAGDNVDHGVYGGRGGTDSARGLGRCAYSVGLEAAGPSCGSGLGHSNGQPKGNGGHSTSYWQTYYSSPRYQCWAPDYDPRPTSGCDIASRDQNTGGAYGTQNSGGMGVREMWDDYFTHAGKGGQPSHPTNSTANPRGGNAGMVVMQYYKDYCFLYTP